MNRENMRTTLSSLLAAIIVAATLVATVGPASARQPTQEPGPQRGLAAIAVLGDRLPAVAATNGLDAPGLRRLLLDDRTLAVDANDELLYIDERPPGEPEPAASGEGVDAAPPVTDPAFFLHSRPGADHTIFLDFDGHTAEGTSWNNSTNPSITTGPYNTDGNPDGWSNSELSVIQQSWQRVAEDFSPFDVDVTTEDPGPEALRRSGSSDAAWGVRVVITPDDWDNCGCGGFAYIGAFDDGADEPAYVFNSSLAGVAEASSHEVGHTLNLAHDGLASGTTYYQGHGSGEASWAPLMGASYSRLVTQWSRGEYFNANNNGSSANYGNGPDDLAVIASLTNGNGFGYRTDDHGDSVGASTVLANSSFVAIGVIEQTSDVDVFSFDAGAGAAVINIDPAPNRPNLNLRAELRTAAGALINVADPTFGLSAGFDLTLAAGSYQIVVSGTGTGSPLASSPTGYTDYASLGEFTIAGTVQPSGPADETPPAAPTGVNASAAEASVTVSWIVGNEPDLASHTVKRSTTSGTGYTDVAELGAGDSSWVDTTAQNSTTYFYVVTAVDTSGNESDFSAEASAQRSDPDVVSGDVATTYGNVSGTSLATTAAGGATQTFTESHSGGRPSRRHDRLEHVWALPVTGGNHIMHVAASATAAGDADGGRFEFSWSTSASGPWTSALEIEPGDGEQAADLGAVSGTIYIRLTDTNRSSGNNANDTIAVDHIYLDGGAGPTALPGAASNPLPGDEATDVSLAPQLSWNLGTDVTSQQVFLGTTSGSLNMIGEPGMGTSIDPGGLEADTTYYWRVVGTNALGDAPAEEWSFRTGAGPTSMEIGSVSLSTVSAGRGQRYGRATVTVVDDFGDPVGQIVVNGQFTGDIVQTVQAETNSNGVAVLTSTERAKKPAFGFCVDSVEGGTLMFDTAASAPFLCGAS